MVIMGMKVSVDMILFHINLVGNERHIGMKDLWGN
jgi:hypothetical protein